MKRDAKLTSLYHRNSALTEFLNERNIRASVIRDRYLRIENGGDNDGEDIDEENPDNQDGRADEEQQDETTDNPEPESSSAAQRRKRRVKSKAPNESSDSEPKSESEAESGQNGRIANGKAKGNKKGKKAKPALTKRQQKRLAKRQKLDESSDDDDSSSSEDEAKYTDGVNGTLRRVRRMRRKRTSRYMNADNDEGMFRQMNKNNGRLPGQTDFCALCHAKFTVSVYSESAPQELVDKIREERQKQKQERELKRLEQQRDQEFLQRAIANRSISQNGDLVEPVPEPSLEPEVVAENEDSEDDQRLENTLLLCPVCSQEKVSKGKTSTSRAQEAKTEAYKTTKLYRKKVAAALLDRREYSNVPSLQDTCINLIIENIENVEALGSLSYHNRDRIARILSRNRQLNTSTVKLFLEPTVKVLELWDCSQINADTLNLIPAYCPYLEKLTLSMCGQVRSEFLIKCASQLKNLKEVHLDGAFLVSETAWSDFLVAIGSRLEKLDIRNTHRFTAMSLSVLVESCPNLTHLTLDRISGLTDPAGYFLIAGLQKLVHLEISNPPQEMVMAEDMSLITDETIITILNSVGAQLQTLVLDGCSELTDRFVTDGLRPCCSPLRLKKLSLANIDQLTDEVMADLFSTWSENLSKLKSGPLMTSINLERCIGLSDESISAMLDFVHPSIVTLNISALPDVSEAAFAVALINHTNEDGSIKEYFPYLESISVNFVQSFNNEVVQKLTEAAPHLEFVEVFGVSNVNKDCSVRPGVKLIGRLDALDL